MRYEPLEKYIKLSQGLAVNKGNAYLFSQTQSSQFPYPLLRIVDLENNNHTVYSRYVSKDASKSVIATKETIMFSRVTCQCFKGFEGVMHNNLFSVELLPNVDISKDYLYVALNSEFVKSQAMRFTSSSVVPDLTHNMFKQIRIPIFDSSTQKRIVHLYNSINKKIQTNNSTLNVLESMAKTIYDYWFLQFEFPNEEGKPYKSSGGKMVWNEELKREIPEGWEAIYLKGQYELSRGISYTSKDIKTGDGVPMINLACVDVKRNYKDGELKYYNGKNTENAKVVSGDMLIACTDLTRDREIIGCPILVPNDGTEYVYSMDMAKLSFPSNKLNDLYMYMTLRTDSYHEYIKRWASGTNVLHLDLKGLDWYNISVPPIILQEKFAEIVQNVHLQKSSLTKENRELASLRDFLLPMLMNGQVTFKEEDE